MRSVCAGRRPPKPALISLRRINTKISAPSSNRVSNWCQQSLRESYARCRRKLQALPRLSAAFFLQAPAFRELRTARLRESVWKRTCPSRPGGQSSESMAEFAGIDEHEMRSEERRVGQEWRSRW